VLQCDDGNNLDGDGCSSSCFLEAGWNCTGGDGTTATACRLAVNVRLELYRTVKTQGRNQVVFYIRLNVPIRLTSNNFNITIPGIPLTSSIQPLNLTHYLLTLNYHQTIQRSKVSIRVSLFSSRRLLTQRLLASTAYLDLEFDYTVSTYPPANYYPEEIVTMFDTFSVVLRVLAFVNLGLAIGCYFGVGRTVYYALETGNLLVVLYVSQGYGLDGFIDWLGYGIVSMKEATLIGGFSLGECSCPAEAFHGTFGYQDQFTQNAGIIFLIFLTLITLYCLLFLSLKCYKLKNRTI
jgi:hypothetical protein